MNTTDSRTVWQTVLVLFDLINTSTARYCAVLYWLFTGYGINHSYEDIHI